MTLHPGELSTDRHRSVESFMPGRHGMARRPVSRYYAPPFAHGEEPAMSKIERVSSADLAELEWESPEAPMHIAAIIELATEIDHAELCSVLAGRIRGVPRLRQRLVTPTHRTREAVWAEDPQFTVERHVSVKSCPPPGDAKELLEIAAEESTRSLPRDRPLWRGTLVTGLESGRCALLVVVHHAVADGLGGLAVLAQLMDAPTLPGAMATLPSSVQSKQVRRASGSPTVGRSMRTLVRSLPTAIGDLVAGARARPPRCSLNQPIGPHRHLAVARAPLAALAATARRHGATVNDVLLVAVVEALHTVLAADGETVTSLTVSVPISRRAATSAAALGNEVGAMPVSVPCDGPLADRLCLVADTTRRRRPSAQGSRRRDPSKLWLDPLLRLLSRLGLFQWFIRRQHLVNTFLTNVRGPDHQLALLSVPVAAVTPISPIAGNITVAFTALSYAGGLSVTVVADAVRWPNSDRIATALDSALRELICAE